MQYYAEIPPVAAMTGRKMESTWWGDFRVAAELGGLKGIKDTYKRGLALAKSDKVYGTEFSLVLNWLCWFYAKDKVVLDDDSLDTQKAKLFKELWEEFDNWVMENWKGEDLSFYISETD